MIPVKCRGSDDCGVACLASVADMSWELAYARLFGQTPHDRGALHRAAQAGLINSNCRTSLVRLSDACTGLYRVSAQHGTNELVGERGLMFVRLTIDEWAGDTHWLAWERSASGIVNVWDPAAGELFEYKPGALHNRGMRLTYWVSITPIKRRRHGNS